MACESRVMLLFVADRRKQLGMPAAHEEEIPTLEVAEKYKKQSLLFDGKRLGVLIVHYCKSLFFHPQHSKFL